MKILKTFLIILIVALSSCSSNDDNGSVDKKIRLKSYSIDIDEFEFVYNNNNQLSGFENSSGNNSVVYNADNQIIQIGTYIYGYNSQGKLSTIDEGDTHADLIYNTQGLLATMNISYFETINRNLVRTFIYDSNNKLIEINTERVEQTYSSKTLLIYDVNNNVVQLIRQSSTDRINFSTSSTVSYTYDDKNNPNKLLLDKLGVNNVFLSYYLNPYETIGFEGLQYFRTRFFSNNNLLSITETYSLNRSTTWYITYAYDDADYPLAGEGVFTSTAGDVTTTYYNWTYETY